MTESDVSGPSGRGAEAPPIRWPPPGLERLQGDLVRVATRAALGGAILVLPLLYVLGRDLQFATLGPFADAWWVTLVLAILGLTFAADALVRTMTLLRRVAKALEQGYDASTIRMVIADSDRDMGFLITGSRHFSEMDATEREAIGAIRVFAASMYVIAGIWLPNALAVGILLAARGWVTPGALWMTTLLPSVALYIFGAVAGTVAQTRVRRARRLWYGRAWVEDLASDEARSWRAELGGGDASGVDTSPTASSRTLLGRAAILLGALAVLVAVPILTLVPTAAIGPVLTELALPGYDNVRSRAAEAEALRSYRVAVDPTVTPSEAGRLLQDLSYAGAQRAAPPGEREPSRRIAQAWLPDLDAPNPMGMAPQFWSDTLFSVVAGGVTPEQRAYLEAMLNHPARADFSRLARAGAIDIAGARYEDPLPAELTLENIPIPRFNEFRNAAYSHVAAAAYELLAGRPERAEEMLEEVVSVGFLLGDWGPNLIDNLVGYALVEGGARGLADLYAATGQSDKQARLSALRAASAGAVDRAGFRYPESTEAAVRSLPEMVSDTSVARGLRWDVFVGITTLTPCLNLQSMVFGPDQEYRDFVEGAHDDLVLWPSEEGLFQIARGGWFGSSPDTPTTLLGRILSISMRTGDGTCGQVLQRLQASGDLF